MEKVFFLQLYFARDEIYLGSSNSDNILHEGQEYSNHVLQRAMFNAYIVAESPVPPMDDPNGPFVIVDFPLVLAKLNGHHFWTNKLYESQWAEKMMSSFWTYWLFQLHINDVAYAEWMESTVHKEMMEIYKAGKSYATMKLPYELQNMKFPKRAFRDFLRYVIIPFVDLLYRNGRIELYYAAEEQNWYSNFDDQMNELQRTILTMEDCTVVTGLEKISTGYMCMVNDLQVHNSKSLSQKGRYESPSEYARCVAKKINDYVLETMLRYHLSCGLVGFIEASSNFV